MTISKRLIELQSECAKLSVPQAFSILVVSKKASVTQIRAAYLAGVHEFAESYWQEAAIKIDALQDLSIKWSFIGRLQSNKCAAIAEKCDWVLSVSHLRHAKALNKARKALDMPPLNICLQVNSDQETQKDGLALHEVPAFIDALATLPYLRLRGFMAIPAVDSANGFTTLADLFDEWQAILGEDFDTLSMGMSGDYRHALAAGSTQIRIGSLFFKD